MAHKSYCLLFMLLMLFPRRSMRAAIIYLRYAQVRQRAPREGGECSASVITRVRWRY